MKKITMIGLLTALTISLSTTIYAGDTNDYTGYEEIIIISSNQAVFSNRIANRLNLTSHQRAQIQKTALLANKKLNTLSQSMHKNALIIHNTFSDHYNNKAIASLTEKQGKLYAEKIQTELKARHHIFSILTVEQQNKIKLLKSLIVS